MATNIALLYWKLLVYSFRIKILETLVCLMLMLKVKTVLSLDALQWQNIFIGSFGTFIR